jgi:hypothetical protein
MSGNKSAKIVIVTDRNGRRHDVIPIAGGIFQQLDIGYAKEAARARFGVDIYVFVQEANGFSVCNQDTTIRSNPLATNNRLNRGWLGLRRGS